MSTRCTVIDGGPFHLFEEANDRFKLTLFVHGAWNGYSGGTYVRKGDLIKFAKQVLEWEDTGEAPDWGNQT